MSPPRTIVIAAAALAVALTNVFSATPTFSKPSQPTGSQPSPAFTNVVTLVTGDRVVLQDDRVITVRPAKGREGTAFARQEDRGDTYVIPTDAAPLIAAGRVDSRLFNVSKLVEAGYDDRSRDAVPLIVTGQGALSARQARVTRALNSLGAGAVEVAKADAGTFWTSVTAARSTSKIWLDAPVRATLDRSAAQVGAPAAWQAGHTGEGVTVAVLDTGIDTSHPDLADAVIGAQDFSESETGTTDHFGHGTHVAGIITGNGAAAGGKYVGVAPDAKLLNGKVLTDSGGGRESWIIAGMEWAAAQGADVINMSLGSAFPSEGNEPMDLAVNQLTAQSGALFVVSAGNSGPYDKSIGSPGAADAALTVGAVDRQDALAEFSSRGPRWANLGLKPDITAPGVDIVSPLADGALLGEYYPIVDGKYLQLSGTSMAAPHVAGAAAILAGQHDGWDADELKPALMNSAAPNTSLTVYQQGAGRLDVARAVRQPVIATPASLGNGIVRWPHHDDEPINSTITYRNDGAEPVTLDISVNVPGAPAGMFTLDQSRITLPAHGSGAVRLVTDTSVPAADRTYGGVVTASNGQTVVRTPVGVTREVESYDVTLNVVNRTGQPTSNYFTRFVNIALQEAVVPYDPSGRVVARVPKGHHYFEASVSTPIETGWSTSVIVEPELAVTADLTLNLDARQAKPIGFALDQPEAKAGEALIGFARETLWGSTGSFYFTGGFDDFYARPSTSATTLGTFEFMLAGLLAKPDGTGGFANSPYLYHVDWSADGRVPADLVPRIRDRDLATVHTRIASSGPDETASKDWLVELPTPATLTERFTPGLPWHSTLVINFDPESFEFDGVIAGAANTYQIGKPVTERWNVGVFGPAFTTVYPDEPQAARTGDVMEFILPLFTDQSPHRQGDSRVADTTMKLYRDGQLVGESPDYWGYFEVPPEPGSYRLKATSTRQSLLSTKVDAAWTFGSRHVPGEEPENLPMMAVRFAPDLNEHNQAKAGRPFAFPVYVQQQPGADNGTLRDLRVQLSYDDGQTWRAVPLIGKGLQRTAIVWHPRGDGFVSLRATATDSKGNAVEQTIIRAYALTS